MNSETFTFWLQGFVELSDTDTVSEKQWLIIKDHLKLVFDKKTPVRTFGREFPGTQDIINSVRSKPLYSDIWKLGDPAPTITC